MFISFAFFLFLFFSDIINDAITLKVLFNFLTISTIVFFFTFLLSENKKKKIGNEKIIVYLTFFSLIVSGILYYFSFSKIEQNQLREHLLNITNEFFKLQNSSEEINALPVIETIIHIVPSINVFSFLITFLINFNITRFFINKLNFSNKYSFEVLNFEIPIIVFFLFNFLFILSTQTSGNFHYLFFNCTITLSFLIFLKDL